MGHGNLKPFTSTYLISWIGLSICSSSQLSCSRSSLIWLCCSKYSLGHLLVRIQYWRGSELFSLVSLAASGYSFFSTMQLEGDVRGRFRGGWSRIWEERCPASCSRFRFPGASGGLLRTCGYCDASIRSAYDSKRGKERTYFPAYGDVAYRRRGRCLYFPSMIAFGCELLAKVFYCLQTCAFANSCLLLDASRLLSYRRSAQTRSVDFRVLHLDPLLQEVAALCVWCWTLLARGPYRLEEMGRQCVHIAAGLEQGVRGIVRRWCSQRARKSWQDAKRLAPI